MGQNWLYLPDRTWKYGALLYAFFPTVSLSYALDDDDTMLASLSYTRGIQYMPFNEISSTVRFLSEYSYTRGNPDLTPAFYNAVQFSATIKKWDIYYKLRIYSQHDPLCDIYRWWKSVGQIFDADEFVLDYRAYSRLYPRIRHNQVVESIRRSDAQKP